MRTIRFAFLSTTLACLATITCENTQIVHGVTTKGVAFIDDSCVVAVLRREFADEIEGPLYPWPYVTTSKISDKLVLVFFDTTGAVTESYEIPDTNFFMPRLIGVYASRVFVQDRALMYVFDIHRKEFTKVAILYSEWAGEDVHGVAFDSTTLLLSRVDYASADSLRMTIIWAMELITGNRTVIDTVAGVWNFWARAGDGSGELFCAGPAGVGYLDVAGSHLEVVSEDSVTALAAGGNNCAIFIRANNSISRVCRENGSLRVASIPVGPDWLIRYYIAGSSDADWLAWCGYNGDSVSGQHVVLRNLVTMEETVLCSDTLG